MSAPPFVIMPRGESVSAEWVRPKHSAHPRFPRENRGPPFCRLAQGEDSLGCMLREVESLDCCRAGRG